MWCGCWASDSHVLLSNSPFPHGNCFLPPFPIPMLFLCQSECYGQGSQNTRSYTLTKLDPFGEEEHRFSGGQSISGGTCKGRRWGINTVTWPAPSPPILCSIPSGSLTCPTMNECFGSMAPPRVGEPLRATYMKKQQSGYGTNTSHCAWRTRDFLGKMLLCSSDKASRSNSLLCSPGRGQEGACSSWTCWGLLVCPQGGAGLRMKPMLQKAREAAARKQHL